MYSFFARVGHPDIRWSILGGYYYYCCYYYYYYYYCAWSWRSSIIIVSDYRLDARGLISDTGKDYFL
jgi:hypothetical protein